MKAFLSCAAALGLLSSFGALSDEFVTSAMDFRPLAPISLTTTDELLPLAWTSAADWSAGGADGVAAKLVVAEASGDAADISTWTASGEPQEIVSTTGGEGVETWTPTQRGIYLVTLLQDDVEVARGHFDLSQTHELADKKSISDCAVELAYVSTGCTGFPLTPTATVTDGGTTLTAGIDYSLSYANNLHPGTATVTLYGIGAYKDSIRMTFEIVPIAPSSVASGDRDGPAVSIIPDDAALELVNRSEFLPIAYNDGETFPTNGAFACWPVGGLPAGEGAVARVSAALLASADASLDDAAWTVLNEASGEGTFAWRPKIGWNALKLEVVRNGEPGAGSLVRLVYVKPQKGTMILIR